MSAPLIQQKILSAATDEDVTGYFPNSLAGQWVECTVYVTFDHTSAAGQVTIETAADQAYPDLWAEIETVDWAAIDKAHYVSITGVFDAVRVRITSEVTAGSCDVYLVAAAN